MTLYRHARRGSLDDDALDALVNCHVQNEFDAELHDPSGIRDVV